MMELGVEGMMLSPGYSYDKAPDQKHFLGRARTRRLFRSILSNRKKSWKFNQSSLFLEFLMGKQQYKCTPWGMPTYNVFGWQKPCYLLQDGYADTFQELLDSTEWQNYGTESGNPEVRQLHGAQRLRSQRGGSHVQRTCAGCGRRSSRFLAGNYEDPDALQMLNEPVKPVHAFNPLVQISSTNSAMEETRA